MKLAARALIIHENKILLVRHRGRDFYALPGGHIDGEEAIQDAMKRELVEELGVEGQVGPLLFVHEFVYPGSGQRSIEFFFRIENAVDFLKWKESSHTEIELEEVVWKPIEVDYPIKPDFLSEALPKILGQELSEYVVSTS